MRTALGGLGLLLLTVLTATLAGAAPVPKPSGWATDNFNLGRWQAHSTAGMAILDVLTLTPERVSWGTDFNGRCDSDYSVAFLPWGQGTYPDNLTPPAQPRDLVYGVVRLKLEPTPCATGDAVVQIAVPLDGSSRAYVTTYASDGRLIGWYGELMGIR